MYFGLIRSKLGKRDGDGINLERKDKMPSAIFVYSFRRQRTKEGMENWVGWTRFKSKFYCDVGNPTLF
jgi:hypothetical protein